MSVATAVARCSICYGPRIAVSTRLLPTLALCPSCDSARDKDGGVDGALAHVVWT